MNARERVHAALRHEPVDRVPVFMWFHPDTGARLARLLEVPAAYVPEAMGNDIEQTWVNNNYAMEGIVHEHEGEGHTDYWGIVWRREGPFNQIVHSPLARATRAEVLQYRFPEAHLEDLLRQMVPITRDRRDRFVGCDVSPCAFEMYWRLRGLEPALVDLASDRDLALTMLGRCADFALALSETACERYDLDWLWTGDDVASQRAMLMSPASWRALVKPHMQRVCAAGKQRGLWVAYHCCGALRPIIGDLIEIGVDVLNPVQCNCPGMDPLELKREYGKQLTFVGGVDTQDMLPNGSVAQVRQATARLLAGMDAGRGGYILAASHTIPPETPDDNIFAMYAEAGISREEILDRAAQVRARLRETT